MPVICQSHQAQDDRTQPFVGAQVWVLTSNFKLELYINVGTGNIKSAICGWLRTRSSNFSSTWRWYRTSPVLVKLASITCLAHKSSCSCFGLVCRISGETQLLTQRKHRKSGGKNNIRNILTWILLYPLTCWPWHFSSCRWFWSGERCVVRKMNIPRRVWVILYEKSLTLCWVSKNDRVPGFKASSTSLFYKEVKSPGVLCQPPGFEERWSRFLCCAHLRRPRAANNR